MLNENNCGGRKMKRAAALLLIGVLILGQPFSAMGVQAQEAAEKSQIRDNAEDSREDKTETVYVKADAEGNVQEISVETVLKNRNNGKKSSGLFKSQRY